MPFCDESLKFCKGEGNCALEMALEYLERGSVQFL
jgi:hypothetical protein